MVKVTYKESGRCDVCGQVDKEGMLIRRWWLLTIFICDSCIGRFFRRFQVGR